MQSLLFFPSSAWGNGRSLSGGAVPVYRPIQQLACSIRALWWWVSVLVSAGRPCMHSLGSVNVPIPTSRKYPLHTLPLRDHPRRFSSPTRMSPCRTEEVHLLNRPDTTLRAKQASRWLCCAAMFLVLFYRGTLTHVYTVYTNSRNSGWVLGAPYS